MKINIQSAQYLNPNVNGIAAPVVVLLYQLKSPYNFNNADYGSLSMSSLVVLGQDLIDKETLEIRPGEKKSIQFTLLPGTQYVGIVAGYRTINTAKWRAIIPIANKSKKVTLNLNSSGLVLS